MEADGIYFNCFEQSDIRDQVIFGTPDHTLTAGNPRRDLYFVLLAKNGEAQGRSEMYKRNANMEKGIRSVIKNAH